MAGPALALDMAQALRDAMDDPEFRREMRFFTGVLMLQGYPVPFYQCLQTAAVKHGLELSTTYETFAYLPALNRLVQLLRARRNEGS
jgi:hypothetical protein